MNQPLPAPGVYPEREGGAILRRVVMAAILAFAVIVVGGQAGGVTDNDVIRVAQRMYCPVCENIPLDECHTIACIEWKDEIRAQLAAGRGDQEILDDFVARFGDHVVGLPQDPLLRALAVVVPLLASALALAAGLIAFRRFPRGGERAPTPLAMAPASDAEYRRRLEEDLARRR